MKHCLSFLSVVAIGLLTACSNPADNVPAAKVSTPISKAPETATAAAKGESAPSGPAQPYSIDAQQSKIQFVGSKVTGKHDGGFTNFMGEFQVVNGALKPTGNKIMIMTSSIWTDTDRLTGHLKSPDFFDTSKFVTAVFESTAITTGPTNTVTGNLTLHGITKQIEFPATVQVSNDQLTVKSEFFISRFDFDMKYPGKADDLIRKEVVIKLDIVAKPGNVTFPPAA